MTQRRTPVRTSERSRRTGRKPAERARERTLELARANEALRADIAERERVEKALRESEERLRRVIAQEQRSRELAERLQASAQAVNESLDLDRVLHTILDELGRVIAYESSTIQLLEGDAMRVIAARGLPPEALGRVRLLSEYPYNRALATRPEPIILAHAQTDALWVRSPEFAAIRSNIGVPLMIRDRIIGALTVDSHRPDRYTSEDAQTALAFARQAAIAIENARLFGAERAARGEAERLWAAAQALGATMDLREVLVLILRELQRVVPLDSASVQELRGRQLLVVGGYGLPNLDEALGMGFGIDDDPNGQVVRTRAPVIVADAPASYPSFRAGPVAVAGVRAWLGVPLLFGDRLLGMLTLDKHEPGFYTEDHARVAMAFAAHAAVALENARLFTSAQKDLADRKRAEEALRESEARYRIVSELTSDWAFAMRVPPEGRPASEWVTEAFTRITGYTLEQVEGLGGFDAIVHPDDAVVARERWERLRAGLSDVSELRILTRDGQTRWLRAHSLPVKQGRRVARVYGAAQDITEAKLKEQEQERLDNAVREAVREWQRTFDAVETPLLILDRRGIVRRLNRAAQEALAKGLDQIVGWPLEFFCEGQPWAKVVELVRGLAQAGPSASGQVSDAEFHRTWDIAANLLPGTEAGEVRIIVVVREVTALVRLKESLARSETLSAMGSLVAGVAHEVRNPLFAISANLDAFEARFGSRQENAEIIAVLREQVDRMGGLMQELLDYGRPIRLAATLESVPEVMEEAVRTCKHLAAGSGVEVVRRVMDDVPVRMDRTRLVQAFQNLLLNAIQHSHRGGSVTVSMGQARHAERCWIEVSVQDQGPGFHAEDLPRIFDPFFTRRRGGTGLGLAIAQRVVEAHEGTISAANRPEGGANVSVRLPLAPAP